MKKTALRIKKALKLIVPKKIAKKFTEHKLAIELLSQDENLKKLTDVILKKRRVIFTLRPLKNKMAIWQVRARHKAFYYTISMTFDPIKRSLVPYGKLDQLSLLAHEFAHIELEHLLRNKKACGLFGSCLKRELEADIAFYGVVKMLGLRLIRDRSSWRNRIIDIMEQCQENGRGRKCLQTILNGNCPEIETIKLYLKMIALDAKEKFLSR